MTWHYAEKHSKTHIVVDTTVCRWKVQTSASDVRHGAAPLFLCLYHLIRIPRSFRPNCDSLLLQWSMLIQHMRHGVVVLVNSFSNVKEIVMKVSTTKS